ncbi:MAG: hypothetical protein SWO11_08615 [Thermodesulfobacteriota bacterium]|nr:hypothetical protein [Thermodesulfobacteriota bacterium]
MKIKKIFLFIIVFILTYSLFGSSGISSQIYDRVSESTDDQIQIGISPPMGGTVAFSALAGHNTVSGVEIRIDGYEKGFTDEMGELLVKWLVAGTHSWSAIYAGREVSQGTFEIVKVVDAKIIDRGAITREGVEVRDFGTIKPFKDDWIFFATVMNTGTTAIDHYTIEMVCNMMKKSAMDIKLIRPAIPSLFWKPFAGKLRNTRRRLNVDIDQNEIKMADHYTKHPIEQVALREPFSEEALFPGEAIALQFEEPYSNCIDQCMRGSATILGTEITTEIEDAENGIMIMTIKKYKFGPFTMNNVKARLTLKGKMASDACKLNLLIDDTLYDTTSWLGCEFL